MLAREKQPKPPPTNRGVTRERQRAAAQAGIDYFTATTTTDGVGAQWLAYFNFHKNASLDEGSRISTKRQWGFDITYINGLTWGCSELGRYLMTASGSNAHEIWQRVLPRATNISRLDLQVTFVHPQGLDSLVSSAYSDQVQHSDRRGRSSVILNSRGGQTLYLGSRTSDQFGRFYYKHAEDPVGYKPGTYRLEVEFKKPRSLTIFRQLYANMKAGLGAPQMIRDTVVTWFLKRGLDAGLALGENAIHTQVSKTLTSDEKKLRWIRTAVAPSLVDLCGRLEFEKLAPALGLTSGELSQLAMFAPEGPGPVALTSAG